MGQIIIEIPQNGVHIFQLQNEETVNKFLADLERTAASDKEEAEEDILGLWTELEPISRAANQ